MGLNSEITADIANALNTDLADAVTDFTATRQSNDDWVINDNGTPTEAYTGRGVFGSYSAYETDGQVIGIHDVKLICLQSEVTGTPLLSNLPNGFEFSIWCLECSEKTAQSAKQKATDLAKKPSKGGDGSKTAKT
ncbi:glutamate 5-kinase [Moraxella bovis]|uniref:Glutamate 5-kinase n=1 Tax=Moraxella bovis TaxID=476 RepID=A0ABY6M983_MORBO|nr:glutamate 5-kinase [Moraxella bovis]UZA04127.1 glutamate 5-kinase [Moraxella bovis]